MWQDEKSMNRYEDQFLRDQMNRLGFKSKSESTLAAVKKVAKKDKPFFESIHRWMNAVHPKN